MRSKNRQEIINTLKLYLVLESGMLKMPLEEFIPQIIKGGVTAVQLRDKDFSIHERFLMGEKLKKLLEGTNVPLIINDRVDLALSLDVQNVHVGIKDIPAHAIRKTFPDIFMGYSCNCPEDIKTAEEADCDYIGMGPAFVTGTKKDLRELRGPAGIKALAESTDLPGVAIGGINASNLLQLKNTGICGVAVSGAVCAAEKPYEAASKLRELCEKL